MQGYRRVSSEGPSSSLALHGARSLRITVQGLHSNELFCASSTLDVTPVPSCYGWSDPKSSPDSAVMSVCVPSGSHFDLIVSVWGPRVPDDFKKATCKARSAEFIVPAEISIDAWQKKVSVKGGRSFTVTLRVDLESVPRECAVPRTLPLPNVGSSNGRVRFRHTGDEDSVRRARHHMTTLEDQTTLSASDGLKTLMESTAAYPVQDLTGVLNDAEIPLWIQMLYPDKDIACPPYDSDFMIYSVQVALSLAGVEDREFITNPFGSPDVLAYFVSWIHVCCPYVSDRDSSGSDTDWYSNSGDFLNQGEGGYDCEDGATGVTYTASCIFYMARRAPRSAHPLVRAVMQLARCYIPFAVDVVANSTNATQARHRHKSGGESLRATVDNEPEKLQLHMFVRLIPASLLRQMLKPSHDGSRPHTEAALRFVQSIECPDGLPVLTVEPTDGIMPTVNEDIGFAKTVARCIHQSKIHCRFFAPQSLYQMDGFYILTTMLYSSVLLIEAGTPELLLFDTQTHKLGADATVSTPDLTLEQYYATRVGAVAAEGPSQEERQAAVFFWQHRQWPGTKTLAPQARAPALRRRKGREVAVIMMEEGKESSFSRQFSVRDAGEVWLSSSQNRRLVFLSMN